jgi:putative lipoprotein
MTSEKRTSLQGEVYYLPKIALPADCTLTVKLSDITLADAPDKVIGVSQTPVNHQVPFPFDVGYNARLLEEGHHYALSARIEQQGRLLWIDDTIHAVELNSNDQTGLKIKVVAVND